MKNKCIYIYIYIYIYRATSSAHEGQRTKVSYTLGKYLALIVPQSQMTLTLIMYGCGHLDA